MPKMIFDFFLFIKQAAARQLKAIELFFQR